MSEHDIEPRLSRLEALVDERDRRYTDVLDARAEALRISQEAGAEALRLAKAAQDYRDERDNRLREQIERERGEYAKKAELEALWERWQLAHQPVVDYVVAAQARDRTRQEGRENQRGQVDTTTRILGVAFAIITIVLSILIYHNATINSKAPTTPTVTVTVPKQ